MRKDPGPDESGSIASRTSRTHPPSLVSGNDIYASARTLGRLLRTTFCYLAHAYATVLSSGNRVRAQFVTCAPPQTLTFSVVMAASGFWEALDRLGLSQYHDGLVQEAFDSWDVLADITEEDL